MRQGILIDLTALLDVVINLMFLVLVTTAQQMESVQTKYQADASANAALTEQVGELKDENSGLLRKVNSYLVFEQNCTILTVSITGGQAIRTVLVESESTSTSKIEMNWENGLYVKNTLRSDLNRRIREAISKSSQFVFIVFQYERDTIYQSDYELIDSAIQAQKVYGNVFFAEYDIMEADKGE